MRFGVNYTPSRGWFHSWLDLDLVEVRADLDGLAQLGADHIRIFPLWPLLQPHRGLIRRRAIDDLCRVIDVAGVLGLDVTVDVLQGHLSSFDFYPAWTRTWHERGIFTDPDVISAEAELVRAVAAALARHPNVKAISLGNEPNNLIPHNPATADQVDAWLDTLLTACHDAAPAIANVHNAYDAVWYAAGHPFSPRAAATKGTMTVVHPWVFSNNCAQRYGPLATETTHLAEYAVELAKAHATAPDRQIWVQEIGAPAPHIPASDAATFAEQSIANVLTCTDVWGLTWWCSHDVSRELADFPELEYSLGLLTNDRRRKPAAAAFAKAAGALAKAATGAPTGAPTGAAIETPRPRITAMLLDDDPDQRPAAGPGGAFFEAWMAAAKRGERLAVASRTQAADPELLAARGITELITEAR